MARRGFSILDAVAPRGAGALGGAARGRRPDNVRAQPPLDADAEAALAPLTTTVSECALRRAAGEPCMSAPAVDLLARFIEARPGPPPPGPEAPPEALPSGPVREAAAALGCPTEACILAHREFRRFAAAAGEGGLPAAELAQRFKPEGPRESLALLSNYDIDATLRRWRREFPAFHACPFAMMDFATNGDAFGAADLGALLAGPAPREAGRRRAETFGCVVNTDRSSGPGKHWVAVFVDARPGPEAPWTVEYFNSAGNPPPPPMAAWMEERRASLAAARGPGGAEAVAVTDLAHQKSQTECGLYALYYIRRRLEGAPFDSFFRRRVPDAAMTAFRRHLFRAPAPA